MNILEKERKLNELEKSISNMNNEEMIQGLKTEIEKIKNSMMINLTAWDRVLLARHALRPTTIDYINNIFDNFIELKGDRLYANDESIIAGIGKLNGTSVTIIGQQKGKTLDENLKRNFAMPHPEGYRKSLRLMKQAVKFNRPIITFIDTPGAYPGIGAEERGQGEAIARNLLEMSKLTVPVIAVVIGEGGSGGALALGVANKVFMLENSIYSILSPEGYATILWKDSKKASVAAEVMKLTSYDLDELGIIDGIIKEPIGGAHRDVMATCINTKKVLVNTLKELSTLSNNECRERRIEKFRNIGFFQRFNYENLGGIKR
jgi:acetyl-CoA carboxylase carboxyl transferase subunit alpha